jgi:hypothetical protein
MRPARSITVGAGLLAALLATTPAAAQPAPPKASPAPGGADPKPSPAPAPPRGPGKTRAAPTGVTEVASFKPVKGFIDDPVAVGSADRLAFIETDAATFATLVVVEGGQPRARFGLPSATDVPVTLALLGEGDAGRVLVISQAESGQQTGAVYDLAGKQVRRFGPAADVTLVERGKKQWVALHQTRPGARNTVQHQVELIDLQTGKRRGAPRRFGIDRQQRSADLDFTVNHWLDGWTRAVGTKGGRWDARANQRTPDVSAEYDVVDGKFVREQPIKDVVQHTRRFEVMAERADRALFVRISDDGTMPELWKRGEVESLVLDQPLQRYDGASISLAVDSAGATWLGLRVDPVNREAVKRGRADVETLDIFRLRGDRATLRASLPVTKRRVRWGALGDVVWVVERNIGFDRGGTALTLYRLGPEPEPEPQPSPSPSPKASPSPSPEASPSPSPKASPSPKPVPAKR